MLLAQQRAILVLSCLYKTVYRTQKLIKPKKFSFKSIFVLKFHDLELCISDFLSAHLIRHY